RHPLHDERDVDRELYHERAAVAAEVRHLRADRFEHGPDALERLIVAADQHRHLPCRKRCGAARHRRVEERCAARLDAGGERVEKTIRSHHHRRLQRIGWAHALEAAPGMWASGEPPPREGNEVEVLVDGAAALPAIARAIADARSYVHLAGWYFSPSFQLEERGASL